MEQSIITDIQRFYPCQEGFEWFKQQPSLEEAWLKCERPEWMLWYLRKKRIGSLEQFVRIALFCAKEAQPYVRNKEDSQKAIDAVEAWLNSPTEENRMKCRDAANATANAANAAYVAAAYAVYWAEDAAYDATYAAANAADYVAAARTEMQVKICNYIRDVISIPFK